MFQKRSTEIEVKADQAEQEAVPASYNLENPLPPEVTETLACDQEEKIRAKEAHARLKRAAQEEVELQKEIAAAETKAELKG